MRYFHEVRFDVIRGGSPILVEVGSLDLPSEYNFRSTFDYPEEVASQIQENGHTKGLKGVPVSCATIFIDIDDPDNVLEARDILVGEGIAFEEYKTGNRGVHFHVPLASRITGADTIYSVKAWLKLVGLWPLLDSSVYKEGGQFRLESATHAKTGKAKVLVDDWDGVPLELLERKEPPRIKTALEVDETGDVRNFFLNLLQKREVGGRHAHCFILWKTGLAAGVNPDTVRECILDWNSRQHTPHSAEMMTRKLEGFR